MLIIKQFLRRCTSWWFITGIIQLLELVKQIAHVTRIAALLLYVFCSVQELFSWLIEVDGSVEDGDRGRIVFTLEYEMSRSRRGVYAPVRNKAVAFVTFQHDSTLALLPVVKVGIH